MSKKSKNLDKEALSFHSNGRPGKLEISATKPLTSQHDLSLAYSPGVAAPCLAIEANPETAYDYTAKGNLVAVISNGTAVLGLGDIGAAASKPVMEGKAVYYGAVFWRNQPGGHQGARMFHHRTATAREDGYSGFS